MGADAHRGGVVGGSRTVAELDACPFGVRHWLLTNIVSRQLQLPLDAIWPLAIVEQVGREVGPAGVGNAAVGLLYLRELEHEGHIAVAVEEIETPALVPLQHGEIAD